MNKDEKWKRLTQHIRDIPNTIDGGLNGIMKQEAKVAPNYKTLLVHILEESGSINARIVNLSNHKFTLFKRYFKIYAALKEIEYSIDILKSNVLLFLLKITK